PRRRRSDPGDADERRGRVLHPCQVADDAGVRGPAPRQDRGVARSRFGDRVVVVRLGEHRTLLQGHRQPALELRAIAGEIVGAPTPATPRKPCCTPIIRPNSCWSVRWLTRADVAGNSRAVPSGRNTWYNRNRGTDVASGRSA